LIKAEHESHLWGESYQQNITDVKDIFNIQVRIAESVAGALKTVIAPEEKRLIDATQGRKTRSVIVTDSNHVILSAIQSETIAQRFSPDCKLSKEDIEE
jgi:regulator of extracellular matrix RemA (YlzA/DUF370 family)